MKLRRKIVSISIAAAALAIAAEPALSDVRETTLTSWNIQVGSDKGMLQNNWPKRKSALKYFLSTGTTDIICLQEVLHEQLEFIQGALPDYDYIGVARDDGKKKGEYCPILFNRKRFKAVQSGTFWLSDTPNDFKNTWDFAHKRICTWAQFRSNDGKSKFFVFNTHFPLNPLAQTKSAELIVKKVNELCPKGESILAGDFNSLPESEAWAKFSRAGLTNCESRLKRVEFSPTYHVQGKAVVCLDGIFVSKGITVKSHQLKDQSVKGVYPSDHFGVVIRFEANQARAN